MQGAIGTVGLLFCAAFVGCLGSGGPSAESGADAVDPGDLREANAPGHGKKPKHGGFSDTSVFPGTYRMNGSYSLVLERGPYAKAPEKVANIGAGPNATQIGYILPAGAAGQRFPVIVQASVYYGPLKEGSLLDSYNGNPVQSVRFLVENYVPHGYAVVLLPIHGAASNGGCYEWWSAAERQDLRTAVNWIKSQAWSDGNLGFIGLSLGGSSAWMAAGLGDPAVKTIVPVASETDLYTWFVRNGTPSVIAAPFGTPAFWFQYSVSPFTFATKPMPAHDPAKTTEGANCPALADAAAAGQYMALTGLPNDPRGYIAARDLRPAVEADYGGSIFLIHGFHDWLAHPHLVYPWANQLEDRGIVVKHLLGQWRHRMPDDATEGAYFQPTQRVDFAEILLHWFDYWLKGDQTVDLGPRVQVADSDLRWRDEKAWPPKAKPVQLELGPVGKLGGGPYADGYVILGPDARRSIVRNDSTSAPDQACPGCSYFASEPFSDGLRFAGLPRLHVTATPLGPAGHVTAYLYALDDGKYRRLGWATMDLRFANGPNSAPLTPGQSVVADLEFEPLDAVVRAGERLVVELFQGGYGEDVAHFPARALAPAATYRSSVPTNPVRVELGGEKTFLVLPELSPMPARYFDAPMAAPSPG